jgi:phage replication-related protein YjqB (UPF0714/DUF867 family)
MPDEYKSFAELAAVEVENRDYRIDPIDRKSAVAIVAPHAGAIECGCSELAREIGGEDTSLYLFEGISSDNNRGLHITSARFRRSICSPTVTSP